MKEILQLLTASRMESEQNNLVTFPRKEWEYFKRPTSFVKGLQSKETALIIVWSALAMSVYYHVGLDVGKGTIDPVVSGGILTIGILLPIVGWLTDTYFGRYNVINCSMWIMWLGALLNVFSLVLAKVNTTYKEDGDKWISRLSSLIMVAGFGAFQANIIQFGIDQLSEASSMEIKSFILWYTMAIFVSGISTQFGFKCTPDYVGVLFVAVCLTLMLCSNFFLNQRLAKTQVVENPLPLICKILLYCTRNRHLGQRLTSEQGVLSKFNIAKAIYGGPFTSEQVEDVKTFFRVMIVIATCTIACSGVSIVDFAESKLVEHLQKWPDKQTVGSCCNRQSIVYADYIIAVALVIVFQIIIYPLFHNCIPKVSITAKFLVAILLYLTNIVGHLGIEIASYGHELEHNKTMVGCVFQDKDYLMDVDYYWVMAPSVFSGLSTFLLILSAIEFICAQAPFNMKGLVFGFTYALFGFGALVQVVVSIPFLFKQTAWNKAPLTCGIWFFIMEGIIALAGFTMVAIMVKQYKRRKRINMLQSDWQQIDTIN